MSVRLPVVYHPAYSAPLPAGHRFPMTKFQALYELLLRDGVIDSAQVNVPPLADSDLLTHAHDSAYVHGVLERSLDERAIRRIGFPLNEGVVTRSRAAVAGTLLTARLALDSGLALNLAGGSHHAFASYGAGYCVFNDVAVAARRLLAGGAVSQVLVIDLDVHQGDGTASICADDRAIFTFSMHGERNFPVRKQVSDLDVALPDGTDDETYLQRLSETLDRLLPALRPDLVFYNAGVDPHRDDRLGRLALTTDGLRRRERMVIERVRSAGSALAGVLGGGYSHALEDLVPRHALMFEEASALA